MNEPQYKPITGMINVNDIQEIIENNRFYQEEIERLNNNINKAIHRIQLIQMDGEVTIRDLTELVNILKGSEK